MIKRIVSKYEDYNMAKLEDFIGYNSSACVNAASIQENFSVFLAACAKVCAIKQVPVPNPDDKAGEDQSPGAASKNTDKGKTEPKLMLKRQVLKELLTDPDFRHVGLYASTAPMTGPPGTVQASKFQTDSVNQLLEMLIEQTRGLKMDILRILRNPIACIKKDQNESADAPSECKFVAGDTVLKMAKEPSLPNDKQLIRDQTEHEIKLVIDPSSSSAQKFYLLDVTSILSLLSELLLTNTPIQDIVLKHNDSKTIKFLLRNIFFLVSASIEASPSKQLFLTNAHYSHSTSHQKFSADRILTVVVFLNQVLLLNHGSPQGPQRTVPDLQTLFIQQASKNILQSKMSVDANQAGAGATPEVKELAESARLLVKYNTVWLLTQFLFQQRPPHNYNKPEDAIFRSKVKLYEQQRAHLVKRLIVECQTAAAPAKNEPEVPSPTALISATKFDSDLVFFKHLRYILNSLESARFLFTKNKIPCMHMCIWAVTSVLKLFESRPELFIQIHGPPPPDSDEDSPKKKRRSRRLNRLSQEEQKGDGGDAEMRADDGGRGAGGVQGAQVAGQAEELVESSHELGLDEDQEDEEEEDDNSEEDSEETEEEPEDEQSEDDDSSDFFQGNDDLSSNREDASGFENESMMERDPDDSDQDSWASISDYGSDYGDEADGVQLVPLQSAQVQSSRPVTKAAAEESESEESGSGSDDGSGDSDVEDDSRLVSLSQEQSLDVTVS